MELSVYFCSTRTALAAALVIGLAGSPLAAPADEPTILSVQTGHSVVVEAPGLTRVAIGDGRIAGVVPIGTSQVVINGKSAGHTTIFVWEANGRRTYEVTVTEQGFDDIAKILRAAINEPTVQVVAFSQNLIVRGTVPDSAAYARLTDILDRFKGAKFTTGHGDGVILNTVTITHPLGTLQDSLAQVPGVTGLRVDPDSKGNVVVSGSVQDATTAEKVLDRVRGLAGPYLSTDGKVIDRLAVLTSSQVDVKVYVLEVDQTASSTLGLRLQSALLNGTYQTQTPNTPGQIYSVGPPSIVGIENPNPTNFFGRVFGIGNIARASLLAPTLDLLMQQGHAKILSSPDLMTTPGNEATFLVGGQIPIPVSNGLGTVTIQYKDFGVNLRVTPTLLGSGAVESKINPEISNLDFSDGVNIQGFVVPALKISRLQTDVITQSGESIVMGGLLSRMEQKTVTKIPLLADIPILGQLFRSTAYQKQDTDVVFVMTPTIITR
jgi:Flp pilus assembly secretin CpaC